jgi:hypothetical protein
MSYVKAMRHHANIRKRKKQSTMYFGFDSGTIKESPSQRQASILLMNIKNWFAARHDGDSAYNRDCVREAIQEYRGLFAENHEHGYHYLDDMEF